MVLKTRYPLKTFLATLGVLLALAVLGVVGFVYSGIYGIGADDPHWGVTSRVLETLRNRSIERQASQVSITSVPNLDNAQLIIAGAGQYAAMCAGCHLAPGLPANELSLGLYPAPPELTKRKLDPRMAYVVIKHGIKMTGMPAWGGPHGDEQVWSLVAFVNKLPGMTPQQYKDYVDSPGAKAAAAMAAHGTAVSSPVPAGASGTPGSAASGMPPGMTNAPPAAPSMGSSGSPATHGSPGHHEMPAVSR